MPPKHTLQQLIEIARAHSERAARTLGATRSRERAEQSKLQLLISYREEYLLRFAEASRKGLERLALINYREFMQRLDDAVRQQGELLARHQHKLEECRTDWRSANGKLKSFDTLDERRKSVERVVQRRREQRQHDEHAARRARGNEGQS